MCAALNPMAASFGLNSNAVAAVAAAAAAAFGAQNNNSANTSSSDSVPGSGNAIASNLLFNLNNVASASYSHSQQSNTSGLTATTTTTSSSASSSAANYSTDKAEWINRIENSHIDRNLMNKLVMNYLVTEGFKEAADKFRTETGIYYQYDLTSLNERIKIREAIEKGRMNDAINLINNLHPELIDNNRLLAFHLQQQQLIELIREKRLEDALTFAQDHLCEYGENNSQIQEELERTMALLAFENPYDSPFRDLLESVHKQRLASEVNSAILEYENLESNTKLNVLIKMLLWSQDLLDKRSIIYPKITDIANAHIDEPLSSTNLTSSN